MSATSSRWSSRPASSSTTPGTPSNGRSSGSPIIPGSGRRASSATPTPRAIGEIVTSYSQLAARRKPELLGPETYSLVHFDEVDRVAREWGLLQGRAETIEAALPREYRDAYFQLVLHPIQAFGNLHALYRAVALNRLYAAQGRAGTNALAEEARLLFARDREIRRRYEEQTAGGRWAHMMSQTHIGYTGWQQPEQDVMPEVRTIDLPERAAMGVALEGERRQLPGERDAGAPPRLRHFQPATASDRGLQSRPHGFPGDGAFGCAVDPPAGRADRGGKRGGHRGRDRLGGGAARPPDRAGPAARLRGQRGHGRGRDVQSGRRGRHCRLHRIRRCRRDRGRPS